MASPLGRMLPFNLFFFLRSNEKFYDPHFAVLFQYGARSALVNMAGALKFNDGHLMFQIDISFKKNCSASPHSITTRSHFDYVTPDSIWWCQTNDNQHSLQFTFIYLFILVSYLFLFRFNLYVFFIQMLAFMHSANEQHFPKFQMNNFRRRYFPIIIPYHVHRNVLPNFRPKLRWS